VPAGSARAALYCLIHGVHSNALQIQGRAERAERSETHFSDPIAVRKYFWDTTDVQLDSSSAVWRANGNWRKWFYGAHLLSEAVMKPREQSKNSQSFQCGKAANPRQWCLLIQAFCVPKF